MAVAVAHGITPLYAEDQNAYFLHGLAHARIGALARDWMASAADPFPVFSGFVFVVARFLPMWTVYVVQLAVVAVYAYALIEIVAATCRVEKTEPAYVAIACVVAAIHAAAVDVALRDGSAWPR